MDYEAFFSKFTQCYADRRVTEADGVATADIDAAEARLGVSLPLALREYYRVLGNSTDLAKIHEQSLFSPNDLQVEDDHLIFMDENQSVVSWGFVVSEMSADDPIVWQRNNTPPTEWFSEEKTFTDFMKRMLDYFSGGGSKEESA